jgi:hypothetical protein
MEMPPMKSDRTRYRAPCDITLDGRRHNGLLIDYSNSGLFIQTSASPDPGQRLDLEVKLRGETLPMHVEVVRRRAVPAQLRTVAGGGIGVRILSAPEAFYTLLAAERQGRESEQPSQKPRARRFTPRPPPRAAPSAATSPPAGGPRRFRVRVRATQGSRSRSLELEASSGSEASRLALEALGEGWKVIEVSRRG